MIIVIKGGLPLKIELVKGVKDVKGKDSLRPLVRCWKPPSTNKLNTTGRCQRVNTVTKVHINTKDTSGMEDDKVGGTRFGTRTFTATMAKLISLTKVLKGDLIKKFAIPFLIQ